MPPLRVTTWLAPSLPLGLFETLVDAIRARTGRSVELTSETAVSGPRPWVDDPFRRGEVDLGFLCAPSWAWLASGPAPSVVAVPAAPVPLDPRAEGRAVYFSDVIVPVRSAARTFADLAGTRWAYNDTCSLSGWFSMASRVGDPATHFAEVVHSGSHLASMQLVADRRADGAAIDSTVLGWVLPADPELASRLRVVESWGPYPIQPVVARADLDPDVLAEVVDALLSFVPGDGRLARYGIAGFVPGAPVFDVVPGSAEAYRSTNVRNPP